jgi:pimeloyl-ACP methyl ester carboxylesterase
VSALNIRTLDGITLAGETQGAGPPVVLLHGLTATRRYVVMGSSTLQRSGHTVIAYDARGHGHSDPAPDAQSYSYERLAGDVLSVLDAVGIERALIAGASMGAHTAIRVALMHPERVAALALITPAYDPAAPNDPVVLARWDRLAQGLRSGGVEGFLEAYDLSTVPVPWRATVERVVRQRLGAQEHPAAVADALEVVPRSQPFERAADLQGILAPTVVVASRDEADPEHPLAIGEQYAAAMPQAYLVVEDSPPPLRSPIAWQGGQLSNVIAQLAGRASWA